MKRRIRKAARAETDIRQISRWIARDSIDAALKWLSDLDEKFLQLARTLGTGTDRSGLRRGMRSSPFGR